MDKVIIDGVDISECSYAITPKRQCPNKPMPYAKETSCIGCKEHNTKLNFCKNNPDCYYKQLKRLEQENEELQEKLDNSFKLCSDCSTTHSFNLQVSENKKLKQENERLKKECTLYDCGNKEWAIEYKKLEDNYTELIDRLDDISYDKSNYYQTLQEIRDIVSEPCIVDENCQTCNSGCMQKDILAKINEVIGEKE